MRSIRNRRELLSRGWSMVGWVLVFAFLLVAPARAEKPIVVSSADPDMAEQGTYDLEVTVGGDSFPSDAEVDFFVTGTTDPGGITVKSVKRQGPKVLKVRIDVDEAAQTQYKFDIQVRSQSNGRSGKGTELFGVTQKSTGGGDTTPPGAPLDLHVSAVSFSTVTLSWTMPADDAYDPASGPVAMCGYDDGFGFLLDAFNVCVEEIYPNWPDPGQQQTCTVNLLEPDTTYSWSVACEDEVGNRSSQAPVVFTTRPFSEYQDPSWAIEEVPIPVDAVMGHGFDADGNVVIGGIVALWNQAGKGKWATVPTVIRVITGVHDESTGSWTWSYEDVPGFASRLQMDPQGRPAFEGGVLIDSRRRIRDLVYTFHDGMGWRSEVVATGGELGLRFPLGFAFDPSGNPAIAWCGEHEEVPGGVRLARRSPSGQWSVEQIGQEFCNDGPTSAELVFDDLGNPAITYQTAVPNTIPRVFVAVRMARWSGTQWLFETICSSPGCSDENVEIFGAPSVVFDPASGEFSIVGYGGQGGWTVGCDRSGPGNWQCTEPLYGQLGQGSLFDTFIAAYTGLGGSLLGVDAAGELFASMGAENGTGIAVARRLIGDVGWSLEFVDHPSTRGLPTLDEGLGGGGPFLALDPWGSPTLTWHWNVGGEPPSEYHLYFAYKTTP